MNEQQIDFDFGDEFEQPKQYMTIERDVADVSKQYIQVNDDMSVSILPKESVKVARVYRAPNENQEMEWLLSLPNSAVEAKKAGVANYYTGEPCAKGHVSARRAKTHVCQQCSCEWARTARKKQDPKTLYQRNYKSEKVSRVAVRRHFALGTVVENREDNPHLLSREDAIKSRMMYFYTGVQCSKGHFAQRYTSTNSCVQCSREAYVRRTQVSVVKVDDVVTVAKYDVEQV